MKTMCAMHALALLFELTACIMFGVAVASESVRANCGYWIGMICCAGCGGEWAIKCRHFRNHKKLIVVFAIRKGSMKDFDRKWHNLWALFLLQLSNFCLNKFGLQLPIVI